MADKKRDDDNKNKAVKLKVSTGAWWKSAPSKEIIPESPPNSSDATRDDAPPPEMIAGPREPAIEERLDAVKTSRARKPRSRRKKPATTDKNETVSGNQPLEAEADAENWPDQQAIVDSVAPAGELSDTSLDEPVVPQTVPAQGATPAGIESDVAEGDQERRERRKSRSGRGRRKKKSAAVAAGPVAQESVPSIPADASAKEEADFYLSGDDDQEFEASFAEDDLEELTEPVVTQKKVCKLLINAEEPEECRLALLENGRLESIHVSTVSRTQTKNNIYKARIVAIEPSLQAAFVDYGTEKNGFLPFSEIHPEYYKQELSPEIQQQVDNHQWKRLTIGDVLEKGQEVLAQVVKEEVGKKGANMTTYLSIPGRCVVLMPGSDSSGISRKISGEEKRSFLRDAMSQVEIPEGIGWIVRTASSEITKEALVRDVEVLLETWDNIKRCGQEMSGVGLVYEEQQSILRFLREHFDPSIEEILVDDRGAMEQVKAFIDMLPVAHRSVKVRLHQGARPIFNQYSVEDQIESIYQPQVSLPSGGSIVINPTEALVAIDVNSGSTSKGKNFEASIFQANMEAADELARQLRLRDLGGLIVVDFIDMRNKKHIQLVEKQVRIAMKKDKAKVDFTRISKFGLMQISRQKLGAPIEAGNYHRCEHCQGRGTVRSVETLSLYYLRRIQTGASRKAVERIECRLPLDVASYLLNYKRNDLGDMEKRYDVEIVIIAEPGMKPMDNDIAFRKPEKEPPAKKQA